MADEHTDLKELVKIWTDRINELDTRLKANMNPDYVALQSEYIRLQKCTIQAQNVLLKKYRDDPDDLVSVEMDNAVVLPDSMIS